MLDPASPLPPFAQIADSIRWRLSVGSLKPGQRLPSTREAAGAWGVNRHTVARAYRELVKAGLLTRLGRGEVAVRAPDSRAVESPAALDAFLRETVDRARERFGVEAGELADRLGALVAAEGRAAAVTVVECTPDQCDDLCAQLESRWRVRAKAALLHDTDTLPPGPVVSTLFHYEEVKAKWPKRAREVRFVTAAVSPGVRSVVEHALRFAVERRITVAALDDPAGARGIIEDLRPLLAGLAPIEPEPVIVSRIHPGAFNWAGAGVVVATPHAYRALPEAARLIPTTVRLHYAVLEPDLVALGQVFGWRPNLGVSRTAHEHGAHS